MLMLLSLFLAAPPTAADAGAAPTRPAARGDKRLVGQFAEILRDPVVKDAKVGILVGRADEGPWLYSLGANTRLHPASNTKLVTTAAALVELGPTFRYRTDLAATEYADGVAKTLYLVGRGDPRFVTESLWALVEDARAAGLRKVKGDLVVDDTWWTSERMAPGFDDKKDDDAAYRAATGAMSLNFNSVSVNLLPGAAVGARPRVLVRPDSGFLKVVNKATTVARGRERLAATARKKGDRTRLQVSGRIPLKHRGVRIRRRIDNPPLYAGLAAKWMLERAGISVAGEVKTGAAPRKRRRLARHVSPAMGSLVADVNKLSNNFMAEHLVRTLGRVKGKAGNWKSGTAVVRRFLDETVGLEGPYRYVNGSGLFGDTRFSPMQLVRLLRYMHNRSPSLPEYAASLAIAGHDGTLRSRNRHLGAGALRAKTGTLNGVVCVSGYVTFADGTPGVFSILMNDVKGRAWKVWKVQDALLKALADYRPPKSK